MKSLFENKQKSQNRLQKRWPCCSFIFSFFLFPFWHHKELEEQFTPVISQRGKLRPRGGKGPLRGPPVTPWHSWGGNPGYPTQVQSLSPGSCWPRGRGRGSEPVRTRAAAALGRAPGTHPEEGCPPGRAGPGHWASWHRRGQHW